MKNPWYTYQVSYKWLKNTDGSGKTYDLDSVAERRAYYQDKVGKEIEFLRDYFRENTFLGYWLAPKQAGKGTYMNGLKEIFGTEMFTHISVGDLVRAADKEYRKDEKKSELYKYAKKHYRGDMHIDEAFDALVGRNTANLVPTELIMVFLRREIEKHDKKSLFIDGFPRNLDQVSYSLYFRELVNYRNDPDIFILINAPVTVLDERMKQRRTCLKCGNSRNIALLPTKEYGYDADTDEYYLVCDLPGCPGGRMVTKEGDELGIETIKDRILADIDVMKRARKLYGIPKIELFNSLEKNKALQYVDKYECTDECVFSRNKAGEVELSKKLWTVHDGDEKFYSLLPPAVVTQLVKQLARVLGYEG
ncbi:MAG: nucleoside monophosphate kinase [Candidatus Dojkabacteria bacterium]|nr:MAG: nucleoside monophosphate kinase [Candidatus Dojkabacteria bacterium]